MSKNKFEQINTGTKAELAITTATEELARIIQKKNFFDNNLVDKFMNLNDDACPASIKNIFVKMENELGETEEDKNELRWRIFKAAKKKAIEEHISKKHEFPADNLLEDYVGYIAEEIAAAVIKKSRSIDELLEKDDLVREILKEKLRFLHSQGVNLNKLGGQISGQAEEYIKERV